jgi:SAM-dependent methyltransferase
MNVDPESQTRPGLRSRLRAWFSQPLGRTVWAAERQQLDGILANLFGYHLLQVGSLGEDGDLLFASRIPHRVVSDGDPWADDCIADMWAHPEAMPIDGDSIDVLVLPHALEFAIDAHQVLREAHRMLVPEGHVVVIGFSPWSLWGVWRLVLGRRGSMPWCGRFFSATRVKDWLALLDFEPVLSRHFFFRPPLKRIGVMNRLGFVERLGRRWWPMLSGVYVLVAKKRVATLTPIKPRWRPKRSLLGGLAEPTTRGFSRGR